jgi:hypothetical protein
MLAFFCSASLSKKGAHLWSGTCGSFTCFTSTQVQKLTSKTLLAARRCPKRGAHFWSGTCGGRRRSAGNFFFRDTWAAFFRIFFVILGLHLPRAAFFAPQAFFLV